MKMNNCETEYYDIDKSNEEKLVRYFDRHGMEGWSFAKSWAFLTSGLLLFFGLILFFAMKDVEFPGWRRDCVRAMGLVGLGYTVLNAFSAWDFYRWEKKTQRKKIRNVVRRRFLKGVDDNPNITAPNLREKANVVYVCDKCDRDYTDPPELLHLHGADTHNNYYQVICPKCWQHTAWFDTPAEAEEAWNKKRRWLLKGSWEDNSEEDC